MFNQFSDLSERDQLTHDDIINMWCSDLEQYPELQGRKKLDMCGKRCCLGQLSYIASLYGVCNRASIADMYDLFEYDGESNYPPPNVTDWAKLTTDLGDFNDGMLSAMNDNGATWPKLAKLIRSKPDGLFTNS